MSGVVGTDNKTEDQGNNDPLKEEITSLDAEAAADPVIVADSKTEDAEQGSGSTDYDHIGMNDKPGQCRKYCGYGVDGKEPLPADLGFYQGADLVEDDHIEAEMDDAAMHVGVGEAAPDFPC